MHLRDLLILKALGRHSLLNPAKVLRTEIEEKKEKVREEVSILLKEKKGQIQNEPKFTQINEDQSSKSQT